MLERYSVRSAELLGKALLHAEVQGRKTVTDVDLLSGAFEKNRELLAGVPRAALEALTRADVADCAAASATVGCITVRFTPDAHRILETADREADGLGSVQVEPLHILVGLLVAMPGIAGALQQWGVDVARLRTHPVQ